MGHALGATAILYLQLELDLGAGTEVPRTLLKSAFSWSWAC